MLQEFTGPVAQLVEQSRLSRDWLRVLKIMFLYLLENIIKNKFYIGVSNDLDRRLIEHNSNNKHFTGKIRGVWKLKYYIKFDSENNARKEEKRLKKAKNKKYILWYFKKFSA